MASRSVVHGLWKKQRAARAWSPGDHILIKPARVDYTPIACDKKTAEGRRVLLGQGISLQRVERGGDREM